jgi:Pyruvate/2-oxoacid:ferredoxin oxidoreductase delta subunit
MLRKVVKIVEDKCTGCGLCASACAEGAIEIVNGKARLISESYCDGLGACLGECPEGAILIEEREAKPFDEEAAEAACHPPTGSPGVERQTPRQSQRPHAATQAPPHSCPGAMMREIKPRPPAQTQEPAGPAASELRHWPVQLKLVAPNAPFLQGADLLLAADCVPFALPDFHPRFLRGRSVIIGCPKLDDASLYVEKLTEIFKRSGLKSVTVLHMEVPCCFGLRRIAETALAASGRSIPLHDVTVGIEGNVLEQR